MTRPRLVIRAAWLVLAVVLVPSFFAGPRTSANWQGAPGRQVVMFGVLATPGGTAMDPKISPVVAARLRQVLPGHGFKLIHNKSERVLQGPSHELDMGGGFEAVAQLMNPLDTTGKVQMQFALNFQGVLQFQSIVVTPADQFNFFDKMLPNNSHLLIGVGAR
jgi:hypothetical protein